MEDRSARPLVLRPTPIQVYVSAADKEVWDQVQAAVDAIRKGQPAYSLSRFVTEAVAEKLARM